jgi:hypothetical protein
MYPQHLFLLVGIVEARPICKCQVCGNSEPVKVRDLGSQSGAAHISRSSYRASFVGPWNCSSAEDAHGDTCGLVQSRTSLRFVRPLWKPLPFIARSSPHRSSPTCAKVDWIKQLVDLTAVDTILDIGSHDALFSPLRWSHVSSRRD